MNTEDFLKSKEITTFEKLVVYILQDHIISTAKDLASLFDINEVTAKKALSNLKKAGLIKKEKVAILLLNNEKGSEKATFNNSDDNSKGSEITTFLDKKVAKKLLINKKGSDFTTFSEKTLSIYIINTDLINNTNSINSGKLSLTSFASASLEDYTVKNNFVNDPDHKVLNQIKKDQTDTIHNSELLPAKAEKKRTRKSSSFPPTVEQVEIYMQQYVEMKKGKFPNLVLIDLAVNAEKYMNYYGAKHWAIKNWKNAAGNWLMNEMGYIQMGSSAPKKVTLEEIEQTEGESTNEINTVTIENEDGSLSVEAAPAEETEQEKERRRAEEMNKFLKDHNYGNDRL